MKVKKIPQRTCLGCKTVKPKKELVRVVRTPQGEIVVDPTGKISGRGAYTCPNIECLELAFKKSILDNALDVQVPDETKEHLRNEMIKLVK